MTGKAMRTGRQQQHAQAGFATGWEQKEKQARRKLQRQRQQH